MTCDRKPLTRGQVILGAIVVLSILLCGAAFSQGQQQAPSPLQVELWRRTTTLWETEQELRRQSALLTEVLRIVEAKGDSVVKAEVGKVAWLEKPGEKRK